MKVKAALSAYHKRRDYAEIMMNLDELHWNMHFNMRLEELIMFWWFTKVRWDGEHSKCLDR